MWKEENKNIYVFLYQPLQLCRFSFILSPPWLLVLTFTDEGNEDLI